MDSPILGRHRPEFTLPDLDGQLRSISEWDGKVIALNFWATWCPPCLKEVPEFVLLQAKYQAQGLQFIGIALQRPEEVRDFVAENGMNYPVLAGELEVIKTGRSLRQPHRRPAVYRDHRQERASGPCQARYPAD